MWRRNIPVYSFMHEGTILHALCSSQSTRRLSQQMLDVGDLLSLDDIIVTVVGVADHKLWLVDENQGTFLGFPSDLLQWMLSKGELKLVKKRTVANDDDDKSMATHGQLVPDEIWKTKYISSASSKHPSSSSSSSNEGFSGFSSNFANNNKSSISSSSSSSSSSSTSCIEQIISDIENSDEFMLEALLNFGSSWKSDETKVLVDWIELLCDIYLIPFWKLTIPMILSFRNFHFTELYD